MAEEKTNVMRLLEQAGLAATVQDTCIQVAW